MTPYKNNKKDDEDPFKKMIEEMMKSVDKMMKENMDKPPEEGEDPQNPSTDITFNFSFNPNQGANMQPRQMKQKKKKEKAEIIERDKEMIVLMEIQNLQEEELEAKLKENRKLSIRAPGLLKEVPLPTEPGEITRQTYRNGVLEIKINKD